MRRQWFVKVIQKVPRILVFFNNFSRKINIVVPWPLGAHRAHAEPLVHNSRRRHECFM